MDIASRRNALLQAPDDGDVATPYHDESRDTAAGAFCAEYLAPSD